MAPQIGTLNLDALLERVAQGKTTQDDADMLREVFLLRVRMHVCAEALTTVLTHGNFIRQHFAVDLRAQVTEALMEDVIQEEIDHKAAAILDQLDQAHSAGGEGEQGCG